MIGEPKGNTTKAERATIRAILDGADGTDEGDRAIVEMILAAPATMLRELLDDLDAVHAILAPAFSVEPPDDVATTDVARQIVKDYAVAGTTMLASSQAKAITEMAAAMSDDDVAALPIRDRATAVIREMNDGSGNYGVVEDAIDMSGREVADLGRVSYDALLKRLQKAEASCAVMRESLRTIDTCNEGDDDRANAIIVAALRRGLADNAGAALWERAQKAEAEVAACIAKQEENEERYRHAVEVEALMSEAVKARDGAISKADAEAARYDLARIRAERAEAHIKTLQDEAKVERAACSALREALEEVMQDSLAGSCRVSARASAKAQSVLGDKTLKDVGTGFLARLRFIEGAMVHRWTTARGHRVMNGPRGCAIEMGDKTWEGDAAAATGVATNITFKDEAAAFRWVTGGALDLNQFDTPAGLAALLNDPPPWTITETVDRETIAGVDMDELYVDVLERLDAQNTLTVCSASGYNHSLMRSYMRKCAAAPLMFNALSLFLSLRGKQSEATLNRAYDDGARAISLAIDGPIHVSRSGTKRQENNK